MVLILKKYLTGAGVIALAFSYNISQVNATCFTPPTCDELGYTTDLASCNLEEYMTCPFDANKVYCPDCETGYYRLTKEQCNPTYGTCEACPYDNTRYRYSKCNSPLVKSNNICICSGGSYPRKKIEDDGGNTCTDARGTWSSGTGCWTNAKVSDGEKCVRQRMSMGQVFTWGGAPIGFVLSDDGVNIRILNMFYIRSTNLNAIEFSECSNCTKSSGCSPEDPFNSCYTEYPTLNAAALNGAIANSYTPSVCSLLNTSPNAYHPSSQYDPICHVSGSATWRLPTYDDTRLIGQLFDWMTGNGRSPQALVYSAVGELKMNELFSTYDPASIGSFMMYDDTGVCGVSGQMQYHQVSFGNGSKCEIDGLGSYDVSVTYTEFDYTDRYAQGRYPIRPVMVIAIQ